MKATITSKGQITIPIKVRRRLNLKAGDVLDFDEEAPLLVARTDFDEKKMKAALGCLKGRSGVSSTQWLEQTRGPVVNPPSKQ
jgi:AbrB family looped-hinge helix DNA binding protein